MGKIYKDKKSKGCALCKPHKHGWDPKKKVKILAFERETDKEIMKASGKQAGQIFKTSGITAMEDMGQGCIIMC